MRCEFLVLPDDAAEPWGGPRRFRYFRHPVFAWGGLRPVLAQHTSAEHATFKRWAAGRLENRRGGGFSRCRAEEGSNSAAEPY